MFLTTTCYFLIVLFSFLSDVQSHRNNVCKNYLDYFFIDISKNCYYDSDVGAKVPEIIQRHIGTYEAHEIHTEDDYILTMFRIPRSNPKGVMLLLHPLIMDSSVWVGQSNESVAFLLWNAGYDIWLGNNRGTYFSQNHRTLNTNDFDYWNFTFHEIGKYDLKAEIDLIKNVTNRSDIIVIGHSMGTTESFIYASLRPEEAKQSVKLFISLGPSTSLSHMISPIKYSTLIIPLAKHIWKLFEIGHVLGFKDLSSKIFRFLTLHSPYKRDFVIGQSINCGWTPDEFDPLLINLMISQSPRAVSVKTLFHYGQLIRGKGRFQMYDYGKEENMRIYGTKDAPDYPLEKIMSPIYLIYSDDDYITNTKDAELLYNKLPKEAKIYGKLRLTGINHIDFLYGKHRNVKIYNKILELLNKIL